MRKRAMLVIAGHVRSDVQTKTISQRPLIASAIV